MKQHSITNNDKKIAIVTGSGSGIGRVSALALAKMGYCVYLVGRRKTALEETQQLQQDLAQQLIPFSCDLTNDDEVDALFNHIDKTHGRLDLLFNNAGIGAPALSPDELTMQDWRNVININLTAVFNCARQAFGLMKKQNPSGGRIINNGSISAQMPRPFSAPYTASKHAITGLTKALSLDGRGYDICCTQIDIGNASTAMTDKMKEGVLQANGQVLPEAQIDVQNVADTICHIASMPLNTNILFVNVMANQMPFVGRG